LPNFIPGERNFPGKIKKKRLTKPMTYDRIIEKGEIENGK
jgi:hypothetical protein